MLCMLNTLYLCVVHLEKGGISYKLNWRYLMKINKQKQQTEIFFIVIKSFEGHYIDVKIMLRQLLWWPVVLFFLIWGGYVMYLLYLYVPQLNITFLKFDISYFHQIKLYNFQPVQYRGGLVYVCHSFICLYCVCLFISIVVMLHSWL